jgi:thiamine biosynthesis lipoprotein
MRLDFGGIAKGYAADECLRIFRALGMASALVDASGDIALGAPPPGTRGWVVAVAELNDPDKVGRSLLLSECGVATSSDARQALVLNGVRYSHIIDPRTGWALTTHCSVTVVAKTAALADGWASALSVLGGERGTRLADQRGDIQALVVSQPNAHASPQEFTTRGFSDCLTQ